MYEQRRFLKRDFIENSELFLESAGTRHPDSQTKLARRERDRLKVCQAKK
jgi:hypothetical protein